MLRHLRRRRFGKLPLVFAGTCASRRRRLRTLRSIVCVQPLGLHSGRLQRSTAACSLQAERTGGFRSARAPWHSFCRLRLELPVAQRGGTTWLRLCWLDGDVTRMSLDEQKLSPHGNVVGALTEIAHEYAGLVGQTPLDPSAVPRIVCDDRPAHSVAPCQGFHQDRRFDPRIELSCDSRSNTQDRIRDRGNLV